MLLFLIHVELSNGLDSRLRSPRCVVALRLSSMETDDYITVALAKVGNNHCEGWSGIWGDIDVLISWGRRARSRVGEGQMTKS